MPPETLAEKLACSMLGQYGIVAIWDLHLAAAAAKRKGKVEIAASLIELADAAEQLIARRAAGDKPTEGARSEPY